MTNEELRIEIGKKLGMSWWSIHPERDFREGAHWCNISDECMLPDDKGDCAMFGKYEDNGRFIAVKDYPNNIAAAWELVEEIKKAGNGIQINIDEDKFNVCISYRPVCRIDDVIVMIVSVDKTTTTAPLAICEAWLAWKETK